MTEPNYSITWQGPVSGVTSGSIGYALVFDGTNYIPATAGNRATYIEVMGVLRTAPNSNNLAEIQHTGPLPRSITGFGAADSGWAIVGASGALTFTASTPSASDYVVGRVIYGLTHLFLSAESTLSLVTVTGAGIPSGWIDVTDYGADPTGLSDSYAAITLAIAALLPGYTLFFPPGIYLTSKTLDLAVNGVSVRGSGSSVSAGIFGTEIRYYASTRTANTGSLTKMFNGTVSPDYSFTHFNYLKLTNASGLVAGDLGSRMRLGAPGTDTGWAANSAWNVEGVIVQIDSATQCIIAVPASSSDATVATNTDANNGAIRWEVSVPIWRVRARDCTFERFGSTVGGTGRPSSHFDTTYPLNSVATHFRYSGVYCGTASGTYARRGTEFGADYIPSAYDTRVPSIVATEGGYRRPFTPYQNDYNFFEFCAFEYVDSAHATGCPTGQCRGNVSYSTAYNNIGGIHGQMSRFLNSAEQALDGGWGSISMDYHGAGGGGFTTWMVDVQKINAPINFYQCYFENTMPGLARCVAGTTQEYPISFVACTFVSRSNISTAWIDWNNGPFVARDCQFYFQGTVTGMTFSVKSNAAASPTAGLFDNCLLPSATDVGGEVLVVSASGAARGRITRKNCREYDIASSTSVALPDLVITRDLSTQAGQHLQRVQSLSQSWTPNVNFIGTATVTGAATTATWTFATAESSATKLYGWAVPISETGGPATDARLVVNVTVNTTTAVVTVYGAPGGAATVTFAIFLARGI